MRRSKNRSDDDFSMGLGQESRPGRFDSEDDRRSDSGWAEDIAEGVSGVKEVNNQIRLKDQRKAG